MKIKPTSAPDRFVVEENRNAGRLPAEASQTSSGGSASLQLKRILVPVDFSACSQKAVQYAVAFARQFAANLTLLYVVEVTFGGGEFGPIDLAPLEQEMRLEGEKRLANLVEAGLRQQVPMEALVRTGQPAQQIVSTAKGREIDLIIISTHGYTGFKHILLGSTTENVVRHAPCPVLVVREHEHEFVAN